MTEVFRCARIFADNKKKFLPKFFSKILLKAFSFAGSEADR